MIQITALLASVGTWHSAGTVEFVSKQYYSVKLSFIECTYMYIQMIGLCQPNVANVQAGWEAAKKGGLPLIFFYLFFIC